MAEIIIPYSPREAFNSYHADDKRFCVTVAHRRAGKTVARINKLLKSAVECKKLNPRFGYVAPYYVQAKDIAWLYLKHYAAPILQYGGKINESELSITLPHNQAVIRLYGADNAERLRGLYFDGLVLDEAQGIAKSVLTTIILPALSDRQGWLDCSGTPRGWENMLGELVKIAKSRPDQWCLQILKASQTGILPLDELERQRQLMSENEYNQEFECDFDAAITGAVYGKQMVVAQNDGRIGEVPLYDGVPVNTAWDLGYDDATAIWFWQLVGKNEIRLIDYYEANGEDITHYCDVINNRGYKYGQHFVPHDAANKLLAAGGRSIVQQAFSQNVKMHVVGSTTQQNGIEAARKTLEYCYFDEKKCEQGLAALKQYQYIFDNDRKVYQSKPRHDWTSHAADAFEIIGQVWRESQKVVEKPKPVFLNEMTFDDLIKSTPKYRNNLL